MSNMLIPGKEDLGDIDLDVTDAWEICDRCGLWETNLSRCVKEDCENVEEAKAMAEDKANE